MPISSSPVRGRVDLPRQTRRHRAHRRRTSTGLALSGPRSRLTPYTERARSLAPLPPSCHPYVVLLLILAPPPLSTLPPAHAPSLLRVSYPIRPLTAAGLAARLAERSLRARLSSQPPRPYRPPLLPSRHDTLHRAEARLVSTYAVDPAAAPTCRCRSALTTALFLARHWLPAVPITLFALSIHAVILFAPLPRTPTMPRTPTIHRAGRHHRPAAVARVAVTSRHGSDSRFGLGWYYQYGDF